MHKIPLFSLIGFISLLFIAFILIYIGYIGVENFLYPGKLMNLSPIIFILLIIALILSGIGIIRKELPKALWIFNIIVIICFMLFPIKLRNKNLYVILNNYGVETIFQFKDIMLSLKQFSMDNLRKMPPIMTAVRQNDIVQAKKIIENESASDGEKSEALLWAQSFEMIKLLVDNGANVNYLDEWNNGILNSGCTTTHHSSYRATKYLITHGLDKKLLSIQSKGFKETPLHCGDSCYFDKGNDCQDEYRNIELMLQYGANPNIKNLNGETPIFTVSDVSRKILIDNGADVSVVNNNGETILFRVQDLELFKTLVQKGLDINHKNNQGKTALEMTRSKIIRDYYYDVK